MDLLHKDVLVSALAIYRRLFEHVVVNMSIALDEFNLSVLDLADRILLIATPEIPAIQNTVRFVEIAARLNLANKISLILNRADSGVEKEALEKQLAFRIAATVRSSGRMAVRTANEGISLFQKDPQLRHEMTRDLASIVEHLAGRPRPAASTASRFSFFVRRAA